jgi:hypothetical protein
MGDTKLSQPRELTAEALSGAAAIARLLISIKCAARLLGGISGEKTPAGSFPRTSMYF